MELVPVQTQRHRKHTSLLRLNVAVALVLDFGKAALIEDAAARYISFDSDSDSHSDSHSHSIQKKRVYVHLYYTIEQ